MSETSPSISTVSAPKRTSRAGRSRRRLILALVLFVAVVGSAAGGYQIFHKANNDVESLPTAKVVRGPMVVSITESGEVEAEEREVITNSARWPAVIKELAEEGKVVQQGELIIRMECKELDDAIVDQDLAVRSAVDAHYAASNKLLVTRKNWAAKMAKAEQAVEDAENELKKYLEGEWPLINQPEADNKILLAKEELKLAERRLESMKTINAEFKDDQPYSRSEIEAEQFKVLRLDKNLKKAEAEKSILETFTHKKVLREKQTALTDAQLDLETTTLEAKTEIRLAEAAEASAEVRLTKQQDRLSELREDAGKLTVIAKKPGLVVYETRRRPWHRPITVAVDEKIEGGQQLMIIPNMETLEVKTRVYEAVREQVRLGLPALIRLDAHPGKLLRGKVTKVAPLPDSQNPWLSPGVKVYPTVVKFENGPENESLKPGMSAQVEIVLAQLKDVLNVPIAAVFADGEITYCFRVNDDGRHERVNVTLGRSSETRAEILSGLNEGDRLLLAPPPGVAVGKRLKEEEEEERPVEPPAEMTTTAPSDQDQRRRAKGDQPGRREQPDRSAATTPASGGT